MRRRLAEHAVIRGLRSSPLLLNGYSLIASAGLTSILGVVFWMVATRLFTPEEVGFGAALISSMTTIGYFAQMNLGSVLNRFLPTAGADRSALVRRVYLAAAVLAAIAATVFAFGVGMLAPPLKVLAENPQAILWFVCSTVIWTVFALQDTALAGLRKSVIVPIENALYSTVKIALLAVLALWALPVPGGIFYAWTLPLLPAVAIVSWIIFKKASEPANEGKAPDLGTVSRFLGWDYAGSLALAAAFGLAPLIVLSVAGEAANAVYYIAWTFTYSIYLVGRSMSMSLVAEGAANRARLRRLVSDTVCHTLPLVSAGVVFVVVAAPLLMRLFGPVYAADGTALLRILVLSCIPWAVTTIFIAAARVTGETRKVAVVQLATLLVFCAVSAVLAQGMGASGVAIAWLCAHGFVAVGIVAVHVWTHGLLSVGEWALTIVASAGQTVQAAKRALGLAEDNKEIAFKLPAEATHYAELRDLQTRPLGGSLSDVSVVLYQLAQSTQPGKDQATKFVLKATTSEKGAASLRRNEHVLEDLNNDSRVSQYQHLFPRLVDKGSTADIQWSLESGVPGRDGSKLLAAGNPRTRLAEVFVTIADLHRSTGSTTKIEEDWISQWIDHPLESLDDLQSGLLSADQRREALGLVREMLVGYLQHRKLLLGRTHGDLAPGNILFTSTGDEPEDYALSGLIDWDNSQDDGPGQYDLYHLLLATRVLRSGEDLGPVVRDVLKNGWSDDERRLLGEAATEEGEFTQSAQRPLILLTWINHLAANLNKSERYAKNRFWIAANLDWVLIALKRDRLLSI